MIENNGKVDIRTYKHLCEPIFTEIKQEIDGVRKMVWVLVTTSSMAFVTSAVNIIIFFVMRG